MTDLPLHLSREGIFPIVSDAEGRPLRAATGLSVSGTIQGEGKLCGMPSLFVRLQGCNLRCQWSSPMGDASPCDTAHTWAPTGGLSMPVSQVVDVIRRNLGSIGHVVLTGGEPYLQPEASTSLCQALHSQLGLHVTVETNGSLVHDPLSQSVQLLSLSPKLTSSGVSPDLRRQSVSAVCHSIRVALQAGSDVQLKFVVASQADEDEILADYSPALALLAPSDVVVMPLGATPAILSQSQPLALGAALRHGWRFGPRLHISLFGNAEGT